MADYNLEGPSWGKTNPTVTWSIAQQNYPDRSFQFSQFLSNDYVADIQSAFSKWSSVANINFVQVADSDKSDIRLGLNSIDGPYNTEGITGYSYSDAKNGSETFTQADIELDSDEGWHLVNGKEVDAANYGSLYPIVLHEIGHAIGLDHYTGGPAIMNPVNSVSDLSNSDIDAIQAIYGARPGYSNTTTAGTGGSSTTSAGASGTGATGANDQISEFYSDSGLHVVDLLQGSVTVTSEASDVFRNHNQSGTNFVFNAGYGHDIIVGFVSSGDGHSTLDLPSSDFSGLGDVLSHTQNTNAGAVLHDQVTGDTIRLAGITKSDLIQNRFSDITFHG